MAAFKVTFDQLSVVDIFLSYVSPVVTLSGATDHVKCKQLFTQKVMKIVMKKLSIHATAARLAVQRRVKNVDFF